MVATIGLPAAIASRITTDIASHSDGWKRRLEEQIELRQRERGGVGHPAGELDVILDTERAPFRFESRPEVSFANHREDSVDASFLDSLRDLDEVEETFLLVVGGNRPDDRAVLRMYAGAERRIAVAVREHDAVSNRANSIVAEPVQALDL
jgi:hypothetical protein